MMRCTLQRGRGQPITWTFFPGTIAKWENSARRRGWGGGGWWWIDALNQPLFLRYFDIKPKRLDLLVVRKNKTLPGPRAKNTTTMRALTIAAYCRPSPFSCNIFKVCTFTFLDKPQWEKYFCRVFKLELFQEQKNIPISKIDQVSFQR